MDKIIIEYVMLYSETGKRETLLIDLVDIESGKFYNRNIHFRRGIVSRRVLPHINCNVSEGDIDAVKERMIED